MLTTVVVLLACTSLMTGLAEQLRNAQSVRSSSVDKDLTYHGRKVLVEIYYETLCPSSLDLLNGSFQKAWQDNKLREIMDVRLYPFGNAEMLSENEVSKVYKASHPNAKYPVINCQHGEQECLGNLVQACAVKQLKTSDSVGLVLCMASQGTSVDIESSSRDCAKKLDISMKQIMDCVTSSQGHDLITALGSKSLNPVLHRTYVPFVLVDGRHEKAADEDNLLGPLCSAVGSPLPHACEASASINDSGHVSLAHHATNSTFCYGSAAKPARQN